MPRPNVAAISGMGCSSLPNLPLDRSTVVDAGPLEPLSVVVEAGGRHRAAGTYAHVYLVLQQLGQLSCESRLLHPVAQVPTVASADDGVGRLHGGQPMLLQDAR